MKIRQRKEMKTKSNHHAWKEGWGGNEGGNGRKLIKGNQEEKLMRRCTKDVWDMWKQLYTKRWNFQRERKKEHQRNQNKSINESEEKDDNEGRRKAMHNKDHRKKKRKRKDEGITWLKDEMEQKHKEIGRDEKHKVKKESERSWK